MKKKNRNIEHEYEQAKEVYIACFPLAMSTYHIFSWLLDHLHLILSNVVT